MSLSVSESLETMLRRIGVPPREIPAVVDAPAAGRTAFVLLCLATAVAIIAIAGLASMLQGGLALELKAQRIAGRPLIFYDHPWWWSGLLIWPTVICGVSYAVHVALRAFPALEEGVTAASLRMQINQIDGKSGRLTEWLLRRTIACAQSKDIPDRTFLQRGNDCVRRVYLVLFVLFALPAVWCLRSDLTAFDLVTPDGIEYASALDGETRRTPWRDLAQMKVDCESGGHGNFRLNFTLGVRSGADVHYVTFAEMFVPLRKFQRDGVLEIQPAAREWMTKPVHRLAMLSDWQNRVVSEGVAIERQDSARCGAFIAEGLKALPEYYGPLAAMLGVTQLSAR